MGEAKDRRLGPKKPSDRFHRLLKLAARDLDGLRAEVARDKSVLTIANDLGETLLHWLAIEGWTEQVRTLADLGADVNTTDEFGTPVLHNAVITNREEIVAELLTRGARPNVETSTGTPLTMAAKNGNAVIAAALIQHGAEVAGQERELAEALERCRPERRAAVLELLRTAGARL